MVWSYWSAVREVGVKRTTMLTGDPPGLGNRIDSFAHTSAVTASMGSFEIDGVPIHNFAIVARR